MDLYLGLDLGTTGMKAVLMDTDMNVQKNAQTASPMESNGDRREFDADDFAHRVFGLIREVLEGVDSGEVRALSAASASGNTIFLGSGDTPLCRAISWTDRRVAGKEEEYLPGFDLAGVYEKTGWPYIGMFPLTHIAWMKKEKPELYSRSKKICMSTEYLLFRLCGEWGMDMSDATTFYLQDQLKGQYCGDYLRYFGIDESRLPPIYPCKTPLGRITLEAAAATGLKPGTNVILGSFDHPSCARGMGVLQPGDLLLSCGTSWAGLLVSEDRERFIKAGLLIDPYLPEDGLWACIFAMTQYGEKIDAAVRRYIDRSDKRFEILGALAQKGKEAGRYVFCSLEDGGACAEKWKDLSKEEIAYSILKSSCAEAVRRIKDLKKWEFVPDRIFMAGGPAASGLWLQILADTAGKDIFCLHRQYGGAVGAAIMAAIGDGRFFSEKEFYRDKKSAYTVYTPNRKDERDESESI